LRKVWKLNSRFKINVPGLIRHVYLGHGVGEEANTPHIFFGKLPIWD
jgi:hypothetical protein